jgi:hypothetical protein
MIEIVALTKPFRAAHPAVDRLTLTVPEGEVCVPSALPVAGNDDDAHHQPDDRARQRHRHRQRP